MESYEDFCRRQHEELAASSPQPGPARHLDWTLGHVANSRVIFRGHPILPPLLGVEQKAEMRKLLTTALEKSTWKAGRSTQEHRVSTTSSSNIPQQLQVKDWKPQLPDFSQPPSASNDSRIDSSIERDRSDEGGGCNRIPCHHATLPAQSLELSQILHASSIVRESNREPLWLPHSDEEENSLAAGSPRDRPASRRRLGLADDCFDDDDAAAAALRKSATGGGGGSGGEGGGDGWCPDEPSRGVYMETAAPSDAQSVEVAEWKVDDRSSDVSGGGGAIDGCVGGGFSGGIVIGSVVGGGGVSVAVSGNEIDGGGGAEDISGTSAGGGSSVSGGGFPPVTASAVLFAEGDGESACGSDGGGGAGEWSEVAQLLEAQARMLMERTSPPGRGEGGRGVGVGGAAGGGVEAGGEGGGEGRWGGLFGLVDLSIGVHWGSEGTEQRRGGDGGRRGGGRGKLEECTNGGAAEVEGRELERVADVRREGTRGEFEGTFGREEGLCGFEVKGAPSRDAEMDGRRGGEVAPSGGSHRERRTRSEGFRGCSGSSSSGTGEFTESPGVAGGRFSLPAAVPPCAWLSERSFERSPGAHDVVPPRDAVGRQPLVVDTSAAQADAVNLTLRSHGVPLNRSYDVATPSPALLASLRAGGGGGSEEVVHEVLKRCLKMELCDVMGVRAKVTCGSYWRAMKDDSRLKGEVGRRGRVSRGPTSPRAPQLRESRSHHHSYLPRRPLPAEQRLTALARGFLTRRLLLTEKVQQLKQTVKDTRDLLRSLGQGTPPRRARSAQDSALYERAFAQLRAALYDVHDIFFATTSYEKVELMRSDREARRERERRRLDRSAEALPQGRPLLSAATQKSLERKFKQRETQQNRAIPRTRGLSVGASDHSRVFRPNQSINTLPPPPAAMATGKLHRPVMAKCKESLISASPSASRCAGARVRKIGGVVGRVGSLVNKKRPSLAM